MRQLVAVLCLLPSMGATASSSEPRAAPLQFVQLKWQRSLPGFKKPQGVWYVEKLDKLP
jgi:hypothetical protein